MHFGLFCTQDFSLPYGFVGALSTQYGSKADKHLFIYCKGNHKIFLHYKKIVAMALSTKVLLYFWRT